MNDIWNRAQAAERNYWGGWIVSGGGRHEIIINRDWAHQQEFLAYMAKWIGIDIRPRTILEVGCGPCGLAPWIVSDERYAVEPLSPWFSAEQGIDYQSFGYKLVVSRFEQLPAGFAPAVVVCCNVLDHVPMPNEMLGQINDVSRQETELLLVYDIRHKVTECHPVETTPETSHHLKPDWSLLDFETIPIVYNENNQHSKEVHGRVYQHWKKV